MSQQLIFAITVWTQCAATLKGLPNVDATSATASAPAKLLVAPHPVGQQHHSLLLVPRMAAGTAVVGKQDTVQQRMQRHHTAPQHIEKLQLGRRDLCRDQLWRPHQGMGKPAAEKALLAACLD